MMPSIIPKRARYQCHKCPKKFVTPSKLREHIYKHTGERPYACEQCQKKYSSSYQLNRHMLKHSNQCLFTCQVCDRSFYRKDHLGKHGEAHLTDKPVYKCDRPGCDKQYCSKLSYTLHIANHAVAEGNLECTMCGLKFSSNEEIVLHLKAHSGSRRVKTAEEPKHSCENCNKPFNFSKDVRRHTVVHTKKQEFPCQFCPQRFGRKDNLNRHLKATHNFTGKKGSTERSEAKTKSVKTVETGQTVIEVQTTRMVTVLKPSTIGSRRSLSSLSQESGITAEFKDTSTSKDLNKQEVFHSPELECVVMITQPRSSEVSDCTHDVGEQRPYESTNHIPTSASSSNASMTVFEMSQYATLPSSTTVDVTENSTTHRDAAQERDITFIEDIPLLLLILPQKPEEHLHHEMQQIQSPHSLAPDGTIDLSRHTIHLTAPFAAPDDSGLRVGLPNSDIESCLFDSNKIVKPVCQDTQSESTSLNESYPSHFPEDLAVAAPDDLGLGVGLPNSDFESDSNTGMKPVCQDAQPKSTSLNESYLIHFPEDLDFAAPDDLELMVGLESTSLNESYPSYFPEDLANIPLNDLFF